MRALGHEGTKCEAQKQADLALVVDRATVKA
jgi:hypothetical protein